MRPWAVSVSPVSAPSRCSATPSVTGPPSQRPTSVARCRWAAENTSVPRSDSIGGTPGSGRRRAPCSAATMRRRGGARGAALPGSTRSTLSWVSPSRSRSYTGGAEPVSCGRSRSHSSTCWASPARRALARSACTPLVSHCACASLSASVPLRAAVTFARTCVPCQSMRAASPSSPGHASLASSAASRSSSVPCESAPAARNSPAGLSAPCSSNSPLAMRPALRRVAPRPSARSAPGPRSAARLGTSVSRSCTRASRRAGAAPVASSPMRPSMRAAPARSSKSSLFRRQPVPSSAAATCACSCRPSSASGCSRRATRRAACAVNAPVSCASRVRRWALRPLRATSPPALASVSSSSSTAASKRSPAGRRASQSIASVRARPLSESCASGACGAHQCMRAASAPTGRSASVARAVLASKLSCAAPCSAGVPSSRACAVRRQPVSAGRSRQRARSAGNASGTAEAARGAHSSDCACRSPARLAKRPPRKAPCNSRFPPPRRGR
jgi:hypothetical protein